MKAIRSDHGSGSYSANIPVCRLSRDESVFHHARGSYSASAQCYSAEHPSLSPLGDRGRPLPPLQPPCASQAPTDYVSRPVSDRTAGRPSGACRTGDPSAAAPAPAVSRPRRLPSHGRRRPQRLPCALPCLVPRVRVSCLLGASRYAGRGQGERKGEGRGVWTGQGAGHASVPPTGRRVFVNEGGGGGAGEYCLYRCTT